MKKIRVLAAAGVTGLFLLGCTTPNFKRSETAETRIAALRATAGELRQTTERTEAALSQFSTEPDPRPAFQQLQAGRADLDSGGQRLSARALELRGQIGAYFDQWRVELPAITDEAMRQSSASRRSVLVDTYNRVPPLVDQATQQCQACVGELKNLETYLGNDLREAGLASATPFIERSRQSVNKLQADLDALVRELDAVAAALTPIRSTGAQQ